MKTRNLWIGGVVLLLLSFVGVKTAPREFFSAYLVAYLLWLGISLGATSIWMMHDLVGGRWGTESRTVFASASRTLPLMLVLFIPQILALPTIYPWTAGKEFPASMAWYLNEPFFYGRALFCFVVWIGIALLLWRRKTSHQGLSGFGLFIYAVTISIAAFDWVLSLDLSLRSTVFGFLVISEQYLSALAFTIFILVIWRRRASLPPITAQSLQDLGNLLITGVLMWAYLAYSQLIISWSGNTQEEVIWYSHRLGAGWRDIGLALIICNFSVPFFLLLFRAFKRNPAYMAMLGGVLMVMQWVNLIWLVVPSITPKTFSVTWFHVLLPIALGSLWMAAFKTAWTRMATLEVNAERGQHGAP